MWEDFLDLFAKWGSVASSIGLIFAVSVFFYTFFFNRLNKKSREIEELNALLTTRGERILRLENKLNESGNRVQVLESRQLENQMAAASAECNSIGEIGALAYLRIFEERHATLAECCWQLAKFSLSHSPDHGNLLLVTAERFARLTELLAPNHPHAGKLISELMLRRIDYGDVRHLHLEALNELAEILDHQAVGGSAELAEQLCSDALAFHNVGQYFAGENVARRSQLMAHRLGGRRHPQSLISNTLVVRCQLGYGGFRLAKAELKSLLPLIKSEFGTDHILAYEASGLYLESLQGLGLFSQAQHFAKELISQCEQSLGANHAVSQNLNFRLADMLCAQNDYATAQQILDKILPFSEQTHGLDGQHTLAIRSLLGSTLAAQGLLEQAHREIDKILQIYSKKYGSDHQFTLVARFRLGQILKAEGKLDEGENELDSVLKIQKEILLPDNQDTMSTLYTLVLIALQKGNSTKASILLDELQALTSRYLDSSHPLSLGANKLRIKWDKDSD